MMQLERHLFKMAHTPVLQLDRHTLFTSRHLMQLMQKIIMPLLLVKFWVSLFYIDTMFNVDNCPRMLMACFVVYDK